MNDIYERALRKIADYDASKPEGYLDEWQEAAAFGAVQEIARNALEPGRAQRLREAADRERGLVRARKRELAHGIGANLRYFYRDSGYDGVFVRVLPRTIDNEDLIWVKVTEVVGRPSPHSSTFHLHAEFTVNTANLMDEHKARGYLAQAPAPRPAPPDPRVERLNAAVGKVVRNLTAYGRLALTDETLDLLQQEIGKELGGHAAVGFTRLPDGSVQVHADGVSRLL